MAESNTVPTPASGNDGDAHPPINRDGRSILWHTLILALCGLSLLVALGSNAKEAYYVYVAPEMFGDLGAQLTRTTGPGPQHVVAREIRPQSPLSDLGINDGDSLLLDHSWDYLRILKAGEHLGLTWLAPGGAQHVVITVPAAAVSSLSERFASHINLLANLTLLLGLFMLWRSHGEPGVVALGMGFIGNGSASPYRWPEASASYPLWHVAINLAFCLVPWLLLFFTMHYYSRTARKLLVCESTAYATLLGLQIAAFCADMYLILNNIGPPRSFSVSLLSSAMQVLGVVLAFVYLLRGWIHSTAEQRKRYGMLIAALALAFGPVVGFTTLVVLSANFRYDPQSAPLLTYWIMQTLGGLLFAYGIFRHKLLDLGFVINRTLIYAIISTGLLVTFGLIEWGSERLLPHESLEASAVVNAAVALTIFLVFHRIRDTVEQMVERVLFRGWHENEARLRRFGQEAAYVGKPDALAAMTIRAFRCFAGGAQAALYLIDTSDYVRVDGEIVSAPVRIDGDDPIAVSMRHDRAVLELSDTSSSPVAALALPLLHGAVLDGFFLLGKKPSGDGYRPDEIAILGATAQQIGLDLHALQVASLESRIVNLEARNGELRDLLGRSAGGMA